MTQTQRLSRRALLAGFSSVSLLAACGTTLPLPYSAPKADVADRFAGNSPARRAGANTWWAAFRDPQLDRLVNEGLARNLDVMSAVAAIREAEANARLVGANDLPQVTGSASAQRGDSNGTGSVSETTSGTLGVSWMVDVFGANRAARRGAGADLDAAYLSADVARLTVVSAIATAYVDARYYQSMRSLTRQSLDSRKQSLRLTEQQDVLGASTRLDVLQAEQLVTQAEAAIPPLETGFDQSVNRLATLTDSTSAKVAAALKSGGQPRAHYSASVGVPADVIRARPDVRMAERQFASAMAGVDEAKANFYPQLTLSGSVTPLDISGGGSMKTWGFGPQLSVPLFTGGANRARLSAAQARAEQSRLAWRSSVLGAVEEVENALAGYNRDSRLVASQTKLVDNAVETVSLSRESYEYGESEFFPVLDAERQLLSSRQELAGALRQQSLNFIKLSAAAAGGIGLKTAAS